MKRRGGGASVESTLASAIAHISLSWVWLGHGHRVDQNQGVEKTLFYDSRLGVMQIMSK